MSDIATHVVLNFGPHAGRDHVGRERARRVAAALLLGDEPHGQRELLGVQFALLLDVAQVPAKKYKICCTSVIPG